MSKAVLISIRPEWCEKIANGAKTIEVRKTHPKLKPPFKCYLYQTKKPVSVSFSGTGRHISEYDKTYWYDERSGKVFGEFVCDRVFPIRVFSNGTIQDYMFNELKKSCVPYDDIVNYIGNGYTGYGWHISKLEIYDTPKDLSEFTKPCVYGEESDVSCFLCDKSGYAPDMHIDCFNTVTRPPQSWCYVEDLK